MSLRPLVKATIKALTWARLPITTVLHSFHCFPTPLPRKSSYPRVSWECVMPADPSCAPVPPFLPNRKRQEEGGAVFTACFASSLEQEVGLNRAQLALLVLPGSNYRK